MIAGSLSSLSLLWEPSAGDAMMEVAGVLALRDEMDWLMRFCTGPFAMDKESIAGRLESELPNGNGLCGPL